MNLTALCRTQSESIFKTFEGVHIYILSREGWAIRNTSVGGVHGAYIKRWKYCPLKWTKFSYMFRHGSRERVTWQIMISEGIEELAWKLNLP
jgi:hypothetical protein